MSALFEIYYRPTTSMALFNGPLNPQELTNDLYRYIRERYPSADIVYHLAKRLPQAILKQMSELSLDEKARFLINVAYGAQELFGIAKYANEQNKEARLEQKTNQIYQQTMTSEIQRYQKLEGSLQRHQKKGQDLEKTLQKKASELAKIQTQQAKNEKNIRDIHSSLG